MTMVYDYVIPGSQTFTGNGNFFVRPYNSLAADGWGGGGGGSGRGADTTFLGSNGNDSTFLALTAGKGLRGENVNGGAGGTATGGDTNTSGLSGGPRSSSPSQPGGNGGSAPGGGAGGEGGAPYSSGSNGSIPGGGGGGCGGDPDFFDRFDPRSGGGSGARVQKTYARGAVAILTSQAVVVGVGGPGGNGSTVDGGNGARGEWRFTWT